jgi:acyl-coenzyme A synthetase/AMP-(fatty) acid ligase
MLDLQRLFVCATCRAALEFRRIDARDISGWLICHTCGSAYPVFDGVVHFPDAMPAAGDLGPQSHDELREQLIGSREKYERFLSLAARRPTFDLYAAFQPFNEATRSIYPFIDALRSILRPGDLVADIWNRTGWSGALLAGLFPEQQVISLWEGPTNVLGYAGYHYWFSARTRPPNLTLGFADPRKGLPFADRAISLLHGLDCLHKLDGANFFAEGERVLTADGAMILPHVHLSNSEPNPFFERGGLHMHGRDYANSRLLTQRRRVFVFSERALFESGTLLMVDQSGTSHYNGLVAVMPERFAGATLGERDLVWNDECHLVLNALVAVDSDTGKARFDREGLAANAEHLVIRHPVYDERLARCLPVKLSQDQLRLLHWAGHATCISDIRERSTLDRRRFDDALNGLIAHEVAAAAPIGEAMARLQRFFAIRRNSAQLCEQHFAALWQGLQAKYGERPVLTVADGSSLSYAEADDLLAAMAKLFREKGVAPGRPLALWAVPGIEAILAVWAAWWIGAAVAPLDPMLPPARVDELIKRLNPGLLLCDADKAGALESRVAQMAVSVNEDLARRDTVFLADSIQSYRGSAIPAAPADDRSLAAILFTSGSTGTPKGVQVTQGALYRGAQCLVDGFGWDERDVLLSLASLHAMSGLRNPCLAALEAGATIALPDFANISHPSAVAAACRALDASILAAAPAFLNTAVHAAKRERLRFGRLRQIVVTGATMSCALAKQAETILGAPVHVYYGLTETGGVCALVPRGEARCDDGDIGRPSSALLRLVDDNGELVAPQEAGSLEVYSANLTPGYIDDPGRTEALYRDGWLRTGDIARREANGHFVLVGRSDDQIKNRFGEIVYPSVIEGLLTRREDVADCAVIPAGADNSPKLAAFVVPAGTGGEEWLAGIERYLSDALGSRFRPDCVIEVQTLPRHSNGKILREPLRALCPD